MTHTKIETRSCETCGQPAEYELVGIVAGHANYPFRWEVDDVHCYNRACPDRDLNLVR